MKLRHMKWVVVATMMGGAFAMLLELLALAFPQHLGEHFPLGGDRITQSYAIFGGCSALATIAICIDMLFGE